MAPVPPPVAAPQRFEPLPPAGRTSVGFGYGASCAWRHTDSRAIAATRRGRSRQMLGVPIDLVEWSLSHLPWLPTAVQPLPPAGRTSVGFGYGASCAWRHTDSKLSLPPAGVEANGMPIDLVEWSCPTSRGCPAVQPLPPAGLDMAPLVPGGTPIAELSLPPAGDGRGKRLACQSIW